MSADEIRTMHIDRVIILPNGGMYPLYVKVKPYYKIPKYKRYMEMDLPLGHTPITPFKYEAQYLSLDKYHSTETVAKTTNNETI